MGFAAAAALCLFHAPQPHVPSIARNACALQSRGANEFHRYRGGVHIGHNMVRLYTLGHSTAHTLQSCYECRCDRKTPRSQWMHL